MFEREYYYANYVNAQNSDSDNTCTRSSAPASGAYEKGILLLNFTVSGVSPVTVNC
jgi:hypothetical protein